MFFSIDELKRFHISKIAGIRLKQKIILVTKVQIFNSNFFYFKFIIFSFEENIST